MIRYLYPGRTFTLRRDFEIPLQLKTRVGLTMITKTWLWWRLRLKYRHHIKTLWRRAFACPRVFDKRMSVNFKNFHPFKRRRIRRSIVRRENKTIMTIYIYIFILCRPSSSPSTVLRMSRAFQMTMIETRAHVFFARLPLFVVYCIRYIPFGDQSKAPGEDGSSGNSQIHTFYSST